VFLFQSTQHHYPTEKHTHQSPPPYAEGINGVAVVTPTPNANAKTAMSTAITTSAAAKDRPKTKNITGPPVYYPPGVELFAKKEETLATQVGTSINMESTNYKEIVFKIYTGLEMDVNYYSSHPLISRMIHFKEAIFSALKYRKYFSLQQCTDE
jgi:hypothetical protein